MADGDELTEGTEDSGAADSTPELTAEQINDLSVSLKIDGNDETRTVSQLIADAQKKGAADNSLREARELLKEHQTAISVYESLMKARGGDTDAMRSAIVGLGYDEEAVDEMLGLLQETEGGEEGGGVGGEVGGQAAAAAQFDSDTARSVKEFFDQARQMGMDPRSLMKILGEGVLKQGQTTVRAAVTDHMANHPEMAKILESGVDSDALAEITEAILSRHLGETKQELTGEAIRFAVGEAAKHMNKLNPTGSKRSSAGNDVLGISGAQLGTEESSLGYLPEKPKERPSSTDDPEKFDAFITHRLQEIARAENMGGSGT